MNFTSNLKEFLPSWTWKAWFEPRLCKNIQISVFIFSLCLRLAWASYSSCSSSSSFFLSLFYLSLSLSFSLVLSEAVFGPFPILQPGLPLLCSLSFSLFVSRSLRSRTRPLSDFVFWLYPLRPPPPPLAPHPHPHPPPLLFSSISFSGRAQSNGFWPGLCGLVAKPHLFVPLPLSASRPAPMMRKTDAQKPSKKQPKSTLGWKSHKRNTHI